MNPKLTAAEDSLWQDSRGRKKDSGISVLNEQGRVEEWNAPAALYIRHQFCFRPDIWGHFSQLQKCLSK